MIFHLNLRHRLGVLAGFFEPQLWQRVDVLIAIFLAVLVAAIGASAIFRRAEPAAAAVSLLVAVLITLSVRDTIDAHAGLYLSGDRFFLPLPLGLWSVVFFTLAAGGRPLDRAADGLVPASGAGGRKQKRLPAWRPARGARRLARGSGLLAVVAVVLASTVSAEEQFGRVTRTLAAADVTAQSFVPTQNASALLAECRTLSTIYRRTGAQVLVTKNRDVAYACAAQSGLNTLDRDYDRRGWLLLQAGTRPVRRVLLQGWPCSRLARVAVTCRSEGSAAVVFILRSHSAA